MTGRRRRPLFCEGLGLFFCLAYQRRSVSGFVPRTQRPLSSPASWIQTSAPSHKGSWSLKAFSTLAAPSKPVQQGEKVLKLRRKDQPHSPNLSRRRHIQIQNLTASAASSAVVESEIDPTSTYASALEALSAYHAVHGDLVIPRRYVVPAEDRFPLAWHGKLLASTVYNMNWWQTHVKQRPERVAELNELGFVWQRLQPEWNLVLEALVTYSSLYGHVLVPTKFVVPHNQSIWPKATWGLALGDCVYRIRARNDFLRGATAGARRDQLDGMGFVWDVHEERFRTFYLTLSHFAKLHSLGAFSPSGTPRPLRVPSTYVVPANDAAWPSHAWGYPLGARCTAVRQKQLYIQNKLERRHMLDELGFHWSGNADLAWLRVSHAAAIYSRLHHRQLDVPYHFKVPARPDNVSEAIDWPWPEHLWGLPLGQRLKDVRVKGAYLRGEFAAKRRRQLDALGFRWEPKRPGRRPKKKKACTTAATENQLLELPKAS